MFAMLALMYFLRVHIKLIAAGAILFLFAADIIIWGAIFVHGEKPDISAHFFDVGQGDSIFIESRDGTQILIDGGPDNKILSFLGEQMQFYDRSLDAVVLTHPHADHVTGLLWVLKRYRVGVLVTSGVSYHTAEAAEFNRIISEQKLPRLIVDRPMIMRFADGAELKFFTPTNSHYEAKPKNIHDAMIVSELDYNGKRILLMGDAEKNIERNLIARGILNDVDVIKVGHHGSKTSSNKEFLKATKPDYAIISVGRRNRYGHPHPDALSRLVTSGAKIFRTDIDGTIRAEIRDTRLLIRSNSRE